MHATFARELQDMVWAYVMDLDEEIGQDADNYLRRNIKRANGAMTSMGDEFWLAQASFVGSVESQEILEPVYKIVFASFACKGQDISVLWTFAEKVFEIQNSDAEDVGRPSWTMF
ncbi:hypothetical protein EJ02DRAFT_432375 [Clathrospora elynae]|uniref:Uncharacterized protein n=1 Tax=Clathrospora elynae TaxID=706981 RepID=A0A6A5SXV0_9PLEO|nr:hypothetical protein EJ02DRAFT_432375 [Clathrospora elynae]